MGTRAAFWIGDPRDKASREWLGCIAFDGYPDNPALSKVIFAGSDEEFRTAVAGLAGKFRDFASPEGGWPYPWNDDIFLTDFTYAFFDGGVNVTCFHRGFVPATEVFLDGFAWPDKDDPSLLGIHSGRDYDRSQPDSILIMRIP